MLNRLPRATPPLSVMLDDLANPKPRDLAKLLGVPERSLRRWIADDNAPRPVLLALFWITRWGVSAADCEAHNQASMFAAWVRVLTDENQRLRQRIKRLGRIGDFGAANDPTPEAEASPQSAVALRLAARLLDPPCAAPGAAAAATAPGPALAAGAPHLPGVA